MVKMLRITCLNIFLKALFLVFFTCAVNYDKLSDIENTSIFKNILNLMVHYYVELMRLLDIDLIEIKLK